MDIKSFARKFSRPLLQTAKYAYGCMPIRWRYPRVFWNTYRFLTDSQWWDRNRLEEFQCRQLEKLINHAYENVPYYRRVFREQGILPTDIRSPKDLPKLPYLTKEIIRANINYMRAKNLPDSDFVELSTSGSTGVPLHFFENREMADIENAFIMRAFDSHGSRLYKDKSVWLRSYVPKDCEPLHCYDRRYRRLYLSAYHLSERTVRAYVGLMDSYSSDLLVGYPSSIYIFSLLLERAGLRPKGLKVAHAGSENLLDEWKQQIETILGVPVKDHYGLAEKVALFHRCSSTDLYHENLEYAVVEVVDCDGDTGEVVGTSLWNYAMPLIRYRTGDKARVYRAGHECACGRSLPLTVEKFEGRTDDIIVTPDRRYLPAVNFYTLMYKTPGIGMFRIIQHSLREVEVQVVPIASFTKESERLLTKGLRERIGDCVEVRINCVHEIRRSERTGKIRTVESRLPLDLALKGDGY